MVRAIPTNIFINFFPDSSSYPTFARFTDSLDQDSNYNVYSFTNFLQMKDLRTGDYSGDKTLSRENVEEVEDDLSSAIDQVVKYI